MDRRNRGEKKREHYGEDNVHARPGDRNGNLLPRRNLLCLVCSGGIPIRLTPFNRLSALWIDIWNGNIPTKRNPADTVLDALPSLLPDRGTEPERETLDP